MGPRLRELAPLGQREQEAGFTQPRADPCRLHVFLRPPPQTTAEMNSSHLEDRYGVGNLSDSTLENLRGRFPRRSEDAKVLTINKMLCIGTSCLCILFIHWQEETAAGLGPLFPADFEKWNNLRQLDGFLCRNDGDCEWMTDTKVDFGFEGLHCREEDVDASVKNKA